MRRAQVNCEVPTGEGKGGAVGCSDVAQMGLVLERNKSGVGMGMRRHKEAARFKGEPTSLRQNLWTYTPGSMLPSHKTEKLVS